MVTKAVAIISARGGSKRIPRKNVLDFFGKPMVAWSIEAALGAGVFERVVVSTDDAEIAAVAQRYGAEVPFLRDQYADDHSPVSAVVADALARLETQKGTRYEIVAQVMPNCPLRDADDIKEAYRQFVESGAEFQVSAFEYGWMNPWWALQLGADRQPAALHPEALRQRSQDLPALYCPTGAIWLARVEAFVKARTFMAPGYRLFPLTWQSALDIDTHSDLEMAEAVYVWRQRRKGEK